MGIRILLAGAAVLALGGCAGMRADAKADAEAGAMAASAAAAAQVSNCRPEEAGAPAATPGQNCDPAVNSPVPR